MSDRAATLAKMSALLTGKQQFLVTHRKGAGWSTLHKTGAGWDFAAGSARLAVLKEAENKGEVVMVLDAQMDERLREHRYSPFRSALCIPIVKSWGVAALIFAEEPDRAQAFTFREAALWQPLADELRESLPDTRPEVGGLPSLSPKAVAGVAGVLFGCMVLSWALRPLPPAPKPKPAFEVPQANQLAPDVVLNGYLQAIQMGRLDTAYLLLDPKLRKKLSQNAFENQIQRWLRDPKVVSELRSRKSHIDTQRPGRCRVEFWRPGAREHWQWVLVQDPEGWRVESVLSK